MLGPRTPDIPDIPDIDASRRHLGTTPARETMPMADVTIDRADLAAVRRLLHEVFPSADRFQDDAFLRWFYTENPDGEAAWRDAVLGQESRAHYGAIPQWYHSRTGEKLLYLSVNSATHTSMRGKGMFTRLGEAVYADIQAGRPPAAGVIGVPNREAYQPRIKRLGWQITEVLPLKVNIGIPIGGAATANAPAEEALAEPGAMISADMLSPGEGWRQRWTLVKLAWRVRNPLGRFWAHRLGEVAALVTTRSVRGMPVAVIVKTLRPPASATTDLGPLIRGIRRFHRTPVVVHIGFHRGLRFPGLDVPLKMRPSPLYLGQRMFDKENSSEPLPIDCFEAFDYDVF